MSEREQQVSSFPSQVHGSRRVNFCRWLLRVLLFVWGTVVVNIFTGTLANLNTTTTDTPLTKLYIVHLAQTYPLLVWSSLGFLAVLTLLSWFGSRGRQVPFPHPLSEQDRVYMLRRLRLRYEQILAQSLQGAVQLELGLASRPAAVQNAVSLSLRLPDQPEQLLPSHTSIVQAYDLAQQELLILGEPGAGKSTLLLELAYHLVEQAEQETQQPLPVLLPLSSWATNRRPLQDWLAEQLALLYDVPGGLSQQWVQAEQLLPLLDGLDEMEVSARAACIAAINTYHREHLRPLVVCSRTDEYDTATTQEGLALHTAVVVQPLSADQVDTHLANLGKPLAALRTALRKNATLQALATTPLLLQVLMLTYHGTSVRDLPHKEALLRQQIWTDYVQRMVERKGDVQRYPLEVTGRWLSWLAQKMRQHNQAIFSLEQLQPAWLPTRRINHYRWSVRLLAGLAIGLGFGLFAGLLAGLAIGLSSGLVFGLAVWLVFGVVVGLRIRRDTKVEPVEILIWSWKNFRFWLVFGVVAGLLTGLGFWLVFGVVVGLSSGLGSRLLVELAVGLLAYLLFGLGPGLLFGLFAGLLAGFSGEHTTAALLFEEKGTRECFLSNS